ncbi:LysR family transcriptional regulator [Brucella endophytica]|uniref:LysR family transcriptional regulator n=1 Tax=Brucella endophytica TaxID=1963359 RepID=A0A916WMH8_9HYPH|nr:LysR substrate-binding domain-containing protein [Brucella endophytica]GGB12270.1 LysR family transcriptional regulator [Brucella endophytica]
MNNRAGEMEVFVEVAEQASFAAAARRLHLSPSAVSKVISRIEERLGTGLLVRSTRSLRLTQEGEVYLKHARDILTQIDEAERTITSGACATPRGRLRVNASVPIANCWVTPFLPEFLEKYPEIELDFSLTDALIDLIEDRTDVAIRVGPLRDSSLKARKLRESRYVVVAAPQYLARRGIPQRPTDLTNHNCLAFNFRRSMDEWPFQDHSATPIRSIPIRGNIQVNNGETARQLTVAGLGIARLARFHVQSDIDAGRLVPILEEFNPGDTELIHAVFVGHEQLVARVRAFVDFLAERMGASS